MFSRSEKKIYSPDFEFILRGTESNVCSISLPGNMNLSMTGLHCNGFSEDGCLTDKFRVHGQIDNFGAEAELFQTIPFGTEFKVKRRFECASSFIRMTLDVDPGKGAIENLKLDDIVLEGDLKTLKIFTAENKEMIFSESQLSEKVKGFAKIISNNTRTHTRSNACAFCASARFIPLYPLSPLYPWRYRLFS